MKIVLVVIVAILNVLILTIPKYYIIFPFLYIFLILLLNIFLILLLIFKPLFWKKNESLRSNQDKEVVDKNKNNNKYFDPHKLIACQPQKQISKDVKILNPKESTDKFVKNRRFTLSFLCLSFFLSSYFMWRFIFNLPCEFIAIYIILLSCFLFSSIYPLRYSKKKHIIETTIKSETFLYALLSGKITTKVTRNK
jgi:hypothetical protein